MNLVPVGFPGLRATAARPLRFHRVVCGLSAVLATAIGLCSLPHSACSLPTGRYWLPTDTTRVPGHTRLLPTGIVLDSVGCDSPAGSAGPYRRSGFMSWKTGPGAARPSGIPSLPDFLRFPAQRRARFRPPSGLGRLQNQGHVPRAQTQAAGDALALPALVGEAQHRPADAAE